MSTNYGIVTAAFCAASAISLLQAQSPTGARASMETFQIPSHGAPLNALVYITAGDGPHPAAVLLHGFSGNERNLDLAPDIRCRGSWGFPDTLARLDPSRLVLIGRSMGGCMVQGAAPDSTIAAIALISAAVQALSARYTHEGMTPLSDCTTEGLAPARWNCLAEVHSIKSRPPLIVTSDDGLAARNTAFTDGLRDAGRGRVALSATVVQWPATLPSQPRP